MVWVHIMETIYRLIVDLQEGCGAQSGPQTFLHGAEGIFIVAKGRSNELDANN
jgi:hypothetical protein